MKKQDQDYSSTERVKLGFRLVDHPWLSLLIFLVLSVLVLGIIGTIVSQGFGIPAESRTAGFINSTVSHLIFLFLIVPFALRLPKGKRPFKAYLSDIGLTRTDSIGHLLLLALSCYIILALSQAAASIVYRFTEGLPVTAGFLRGVFDVSGDLPPQSLSPLFSLPSAFEEVGFRGVILTLFLSKYSRRGSIVIAAGAFGLIHVLNLLSGREAVWVAGQVGWAFCMGIFYGYLFVKTGSLIPPMVVHYLGNVFIGSFTSYIQGLAPIGVQAIYGVVFSFGIVPVVFMILWTSFFTRKWLFPQQSASAGASSPQQPRYKNVV